MSALATLRNVSFVTADGRALFQNLNLTFDRERTGLVGRNGVGKTTLLRLIGGTLPPSSGAVTPGGRIGYLRQNPENGAGRTVAEEMGIAEGLACLARIAAGEGQDDDFNLADWTLEQRAADALAEAGLPGLALDRTLAALSGGQRTRVALAGLILAQPDLLLLDEPTNNLDADGRAALVAFLGSWRGGAVIVSHDRTLLRHMDRIIELSDLGAAVYGGNWDFYKEQKAAEAEAAARGLMQARREVAETERRIHAATERQERRNAAGKRARAEGGMPKILLDARRDRAGRTEGRGGQLAERMRGEAQEQLDAAAAKVERLRERNFTVAGNDQPSGRRIVTLTHISGGPAEKPSVIRDLSLTVLGGERLAVAGPNGSGKTTLLKMIAGLLPVQGGEITHYGTVAMLDQDVGLLDPQETVLANFRRLNPDSNDNACRAALARFLFRAEAALQLVCTLSGGERLRAGLACVLGGSKPPDLLVLDEPTNHLDLASIEAMETALQDYGGALIVVSHDEDFLEAIGIEARISLGKVKPRP